MLNDKIKINKKTLFQRTILYKEGDNDFSSSISSC